jgi:hypothetical protein
MSPSSEVPTRGARLPLPKTPEIGDPEPYNHRESGEYWFKEPKWEEQPCAPSRATRINLHLHRYPVTGMGLHWGAF